MANVPCDLIEGEEIYRPATPEEGQSFVELWCLACALYKGGGNQDASCPVLAASYTAEGTPCWRIRFGLRTCTSFIPAPKMRGANRTGELL
jgi:hypothetical protein